MRALTPSERHTQLGNDVIVYINQHAKAIAQRVSVGTIAGKYLSTAEGTPDVIASINSYFCGLECKTGEATLNPAQRAWHKRWLLQGARVVVVRSLTDVERLIKQCGLTPNPIPKPNAKAPNTKASKP